MNDFVKSLINDNKLQFKSGNLSLCGMSCNALTLANLATFFHIMQSRHGRDFDEIVKQVGEAQVKSLAGVIFPGKRILNLNELKLIINYLEVFGTGNLKITEIDQKSKKMFFQSANSPFSHMVVKLFGFSDRQHVNPFLCGICQGIGALAFDCDLESEEHDDIAKKKEFCCIEARSSLNKKKHSVISEYNDKNMGRIKRDLPHASSDFIKKVIGHYMINWENGIFSIWQVPGYIIPTATLLFMLKSMEKEFGSYVYSVLYHLARVQSRESFMLQVKKFGFKKDRNLLESLLEHSALTGFGVVSLSSLDLKKEEMVLEQSFNPYPHCHRELFGLSENAVDFYVAGLAAGAAEGFFEKPMSCHEVSCVAMNDSLCKFEIKKSGGERYKIEEGDLNVIEEKINARNFTL